MQNIIRQSLHLCVLVIFALLSACASSPDIQTTKPAQTFDMVIYNKARAAFEAGNYKTAASLFDPLAENGNADAQYSLGYLFYHGKGVQKDLKQAMYWFNQSAKQGNEKAIAALNTIESLLKKETQDDTQAVEDTSPTQAYPVPAPQQTGLLDLRQRTQSAPNRTPALTQTSPQPAQRQYQPAEVTPTYDSVVTSKPEVSEKPVTHEKPLIKPEPSPAMVLTPMEKEHRKWIMQQPSSYYTIQLASSSQKKHILAYVDKVALDGIYFYGETRNNTTRYYVIHGSFDTYRKARRKLRLLNKRGYKDAWIRDMKGVRKSLQQ